MKREQNFPPILGAQKRGTHVANGPVSPQGKEEHVGEALKAEPRWGVILSWFCLFVAKVAEAEPGGRVD